MYYAYLESSTNYLVISIDIIHAYKNYTYNFIIIVPIKYSSQVRVYIATDS